MSRQFSVRLQTPQGSPLFEMEDGDLWILLGRLNELPLESSARLAALEPFLAPEDAQLPPPPGSRPRIWRPTDLLAGIDLILSALGSRGPAWAGDPDWSARMTYSIDELQSLFSALRKEVATLPPDSPILTRRA